jgi:DNA invertase Pin-like site-specific DNA recombinase
VYVRQSTPDQVQRHQESTQRQYQLRERALALGWPASAVEIIDDDQGRSGRWAAHRPGFQHLVAQVGLGQVGLVLMPEASRLARNNSDWHHLIEICGLRGTLIADESAVYDPRDPNDRLLLGLKGTLSEAELFTLRTRLYEGRWSKARKGQLRFCVPVGYVEGPTGQWEKDPDAQVRERLDYVFATFRRLGVARAVVRALRAAPLDLPVRGTAKEGYGLLTWKAPTLSAVMRVLSNPAYGGAYVYGRWDYTGERRSARSGKVLPRLRPREAWTVCLPDHHPGYLPWDEFVHNQERLRANWGRDGQPGPPRDGPALLQGIVFCGVCGQKMAVQHRAQSEHRSAGYLCSRGYQDGDPHICQSMTACPIDTAVSAAFLEAVSPLGVAVAVQVLDRVEQDLAAERQQRALQLEQARYEARLAQRQYDAVDPEHRLVAAELERRWNAKLDRVAHLERAHAQAEQAARWTLSAEERATISGLAADLPGIWQAESTTMAERKQLLRNTVAAVQLDGVSRPGQIEVQIHWRTGTVTILHVARSAPGEGSLKTPEGAVALLRALAPTHTYAEIARHLTAAGWHSAFGRAFTREHVGYLCRREGLGRGPTRRPDPQAGQRPAPPSPPPSDVTPLWADSAVTDPAPSAGSLSPTEHGTRAES